jgi:hypothetical protein
VSYPRRAALGSLLVAALLPACTPKGDKLPPPEPSSSATATSAPVETARADDEIRPVYPLKVTSDPLAQRLCGALQELPERRRAECCGRVPGASFTDECVRTLSYAIGAKTVTVDPLDADRCVEAMSRAYEGCSWVGPNAIPVPEACLGIIKGNVPDGGVCRSSLDCATGKHCQGSGPTHLGVCAPPLPARYACDLGVDTLVTYTRQTSAEAQHPECVGYCMRRRCFEATPIGGACKVTPECGPGRACTAGKCSDAPTPVAGKPCPAGACMNGARCVKGACITPRAEGEACTADAECRGACARPDGGARGACSKSCSY